MKKLLGIAALVLLVGAGCAGQDNATTTQEPGNEAYPFGIQGTSNDTTSQALPDRGVPAVGTATATPPAATAQVAYTSSDTFSPAVVTIPVGGTVTWTNAGDEDMRVASDPHPTHIGYPGFDSMSNVGPGKTYSFTFQKKGSWGYHDHLDPTVKGTVIVQ